MRPLTEERNPATQQLDTLSTLEMLHLMNTEDTRVPAAVATALPHIAEAVDRIAERMRAGGRLIYMGAGTSGRLGALDAAECPPTFSTPPGMVIALMAGGSTAIARASEDAEDDQSAGAHDLEAIGFNTSDTLIGIAASGATPYVLGGMAAARACGALVIGIACSAPSPVGDLADISIALLTGPEVITGSTRLKAGTAQKLALNMISTIVMVRLGKTYGNLMVDLQATNTKLRKRAQWIVGEACGVPENEAADLLTRAGGEVKTAIVAFLCGISPEEARKRLVGADGAVRIAITQ